jgi:DNA-binding SARP family transcriptional activator/tetratricopeptide (TPR) repeat protein
LPRAELRLLGSPRFRIDGEGQALPEKAFVLLTILASAEGRSATRSQIRTILWADSDRDKGNASLRQLIARIHRIEQISGVVLLSTEGEAVALTSSCQVDYADFLAAIRHHHASDAKSDIDGRCEALTELWRGALLEGIAFGEAALDEWLEAAREQMRQRFLEAGRNLFTLPQHADAQWRLAVRILEVDRTEEAAYRCMMRICIARGDRGLGLRVFTRCRRVLYADLATEPDDETLALAAQLQDPAAARSNAAAKIGERPEERTHGATASGGPPRRQVPVVMVVPLVGLGLGETLSSLTSGLAEDIIVGLTRFRRFAVVAAQTPGVMPLKDRCLENGLSVFDIDYTVSLSLMPAAHGYRLAVRLTDASNAEVLWGTNPEFTMATVGDTFDRLIRLTVRTLVDAIDTRQMNMAMTAEYVPAYALCVQGRRLLHKSDLLAIRRAKKLFKQALAQVPDYPQALIGIARATSEESLIRGMVEQDLLKEAVALANRASELDPLDGRALREKGRASLYMRRYEESLEAFDAAIGLNPDDADILSDYADALAHVGEPQRGLPLSRRAMELNPTQPDDYVWTLGSIHYQLGEYQTALDALRPMEGSAATARLLSACAAQVGDRDLAHRYSQIVRENYPKFEVETVREIVPNRNSADADHLIDGLRLAGLG